MTLASKNPRFRLEGDQAGKSRVSPDGWKSRESGAFSVEKRKKNHLPPPTTCCHPLHRPRHHHRHHQHHRQHCCRHRSRRWRQRHCPLSLSRPVFCFRRRWDSWEKPTPWLAKRASPGSRVWQNHVAGRPRVDPRFANRSESTVGRSAWPVDCAVRRSVTFVSYKRVGAQDGVSARRRGCYASDGLQMGVRLAQLSVQACGCMLNQ